MKRAIWFIIMVLAAFGAIYGVGYFIHYEKWMGLVGIVALVCLGLPKAIATVKEILHSAEPKPEEK